MEKEGKDTDNSRGQESPEDASQDLADGDGQIGNRGGLKLFKDAPVEACDVDLAGDGEAAGHTSHGDESGDEEGDVRDALNRHALSQSPAKGNEIKKGRDGEGYQHL